MPEQLLDLAARLLEGQPVLPKFLSECSQLGQRLQKQRQDFLSNGPRDSNAQLLSSEVNAVLDSFELCSQWLDVCNDYASEFDPACLHNAVESAPVVFGRLHFDFFRLQRASWSLTGPYTHAGINRLLESQEEVELMIPEEHDLQEAQLTSRTEQGAWADLSRKWSLQYLELLQAARGEDWFDRLEALGEGYQKLDLEAFARRYAAGPTSYAWINLAIHSIYFLERDAMHRALVEHIFQSAHDQLAATVESAELAEKRQKQAGVAAEISSDLLDWLEEGARLQKHFKQEVYQAWAEDGIQLARELQETIRNA